MKNPIVFQDFSRHFFVGIEKFMDLSDEVEVYKFATASLTDKEVRELRRFIQQIVATKTDAELQAIWRKGKADVEFEPVRPLLERCIVYIDQHRL